MTTKISPKSIYPSTLFLSFREVCFFAVIVIVMCIFDSLIEDGRIWIPSTPHAIKVSLIIFIINWLAIYIACKFGATTTTNGFDFDKSGHIKRWGRVPGTFAVSLITLILTLLFLAVAGQIHE